MGNRLWGEQVTVLPAHKYRDPIDVLFAKENAIEYRIRLVEKIGVERVEWLEADQRPRKWSIEELKQITATYKQKLRDLKKGIE